MSQPPAREAMEENMTLDQLHEFTAAAKDFCGAPGTVYAHAYMSVYPVYQYHVYM